MLRQKKVSKEKASQRPCPYGVPCATHAVRGRAQTRCAQTSARPDPASAALLSTANGLGSLNTASARSLRSPCTPVLGLDCHLGCACRGPYFLLLRQKKVAKEKASQRPCPYGVPCATRAARAVVAALASATTSKTTTAPTAAAAPSPNPLTTTASFPNLGQQTRTAASRTHNPYPAQKSQIGYFGSPSPRRG